jgi:hypothetical protein
VLGIFPILALTTLLAPVPGPERAAASTPSPDASTSLALEIRTPPILACARPSTNPAMFSQLIDSPSLHPSRLREVRWGRIHWGPVRAGVGDGWEMERT